MKVPHGGGIWSAARSLGLEPGELMDFSASVTPLGLSPLTGERIRESLDMLANYPDPSAHELIEKLSAFHGVETVNIALGNGSIELLYLLPEVLQPKRALIVEPAFGEYARSLELAGCRVESFQLDEAGAFRVDIDALTARLDDGDGFDILYMANPANPTGVLTSKSDMERIAEAAEAAGTYFLLDEAFCDFTEDASIKRLAAKSGHLAVTRSMTKFFGLAGLRLGMLIASEGIISAIDERKVPWSINSMAISAGCASLEDSLHTKRIRQWFVEEREFMRGELASIDGITLFETSANFFMLKLGPFVTAGPMLRERLLKDRIIIRTLSEFSGLGEKFVRVSIRERADNIFLLERLSAALKELAPG